MMKIDEEIKGGTDKHSNLIIASAIELLLNYCTRFYDRQFITRKKANKDILGTFEEMLDNYFTSENPKRLGTPTVAYCAEQLHLSSNYFGDLIKKENGQICTRVYPAENDEHGINHARGFKQNNQRDSLRFRLPVPAVFQQGFQKNRRIYT